MVDRRTVLKTVGTFGLLAAGGSLAARADAVNGLRFDASQYTQLTKTIKTATGEKVVVYRFYKAIPYVSHPVDAAYQSLNISVPVTIDGQAVDTRHVPILFSNSVGGYMPSSVANATGIGGGPIMGMPPGGMGKPPAGMPPMGMGMPPMGGPGGEVKSGGNAMLNRGKMVSNAELALAAGLVVVEPGARGRTLTDAQGIYYGVAPAAIVDLKAAVRYLKFNTGLIPGNTDRIISSGTSAGGALSALLGASGDSPLYEPYLKALGAAPASDAIFATGAWCPITDLEHADMAYEWNWGSNPLASGSPVDQTTSQALKDGFATYQASLGLTGENGFGPLTADSYGAYLLKTWLQPAATRYLKGLSDSDRAAYLAKYPDIHWDGQKASLTWSDYLSHVGARKKSVPAFDAFDLSSGENNLFGTGTTKARHFTAFGLQKTGQGQIDPDLPALLTLMNPMPFIRQNNPSRSKHWWIRVGTKDSDTSLTVVGNLTTALQNRGDSVNTLMYWDSGHGANEDAEAFVAWMKGLAG